MENLSQEQLNNDKNNQSELIPEISEKIAEEKLRALINEERQKMQNGESFDAHFEHINFDELTKEEKGLYCKLLNNKLEKEEIDIFWNKINQLPKEKLKFDKNDLPTNSGSNFLAFLGNRLQDKAYEQLLKERSKGAQENLQQI